VWVDVSQVRGGCASDMACVVSCVCGWYRRTAVFVVTKSDANGPEDRETLWIERRTHDDCRAVARGPSPSFRMRTRVPSESWPSTVYNNTIDRSCLSQASPLDTQTPPCRLTSRETAIPRPTATRMAPHSIHRLSRPSHRQRLCPTMSTMSCTQMSVCRIAKHPTID
jgi:hypothetical protein